jgi:hypothetical protein
MFKLRKLSPLDYLGLTPFSHPKTYARREEFERMVGTPRHRVLISVVEELGRPKALIAAVQIATHPRK